MLRNSTAKLVDQAGATLGTAWCLSPQLMVTAAHCLPTASTRETVSLEFATGKLIGTVLWSSASLDACLLRIKNAEILTPSVIPVASLSNVPSGGLTWMAFGYPRAHDEGLTITGTVSSCDGRLNGERVIELGCFQGVDASALEGMSGGAVTINNRCIGVVVFAPPDLYQRVIFAVPIESIGLSALHSGLLSDPTDVATLRAILPLQTDSFDVTLAQYLEAIRHSTTRIPRSAMLALGAMPSPLSSSDVFVPLSFRPVIGGQDEQSQQASGIRCDIASELNYTTFSIENAIRQANAGPLRHVFFFGDPGSGKSFLFRYLASKAWDQPKSIGLDRPHIPILVRLKNLSQQVSVLEDWLWEAMCRGSDIRPPRRPPQGFLSEWATRSGAPWLFLFDGFDEIPTRLRPTMLDQVGLLLDAEQYLCFLTSRPAQGSSDPVLLLCNTCSCFEIQPLASEQEQMLAEKWLSSAAPRFMDEFQRMRLNARRITPLLITIAAGVFKTYGALPESRSGLYESLVNACAQDARARGLDDEIGPRLSTLVRPLLETLAVSCVEDKSARGYAAMIESCKIFVKKTLRVGNDEASIEGSRAVMVLGRLSGLFFCDNQRFSWWHPTIQEYLAACLLARTSTEDQLHKLCLKWRNEAWSGVVFFLFSLLDREREGREEQIMALCTRLAYTIINDEQTERSKRLREANSDNSLATFGGVGLFLSAALVEGAAFDSKLISLLINFLKESCRHAGKFDFCREVYEQLSNSGRSPVELLGQLTSHGSARSALIDILRDGSLQHWVHESAALACSRSGMTGDLQQMLQASTIDEKTRQLIQSSLHSQTKEH